MGQELREGVIIATHGLLAGLAPGEAELQGRERVGLGHEVFLHHVPAEGHGREDTPLVVLETGSTVGADRGGQEVLVGEAVVGAAEEGDQVEFALAAAVGELGAVADAVGQAVVLAVEALPGITGHQVDVVLAEGLVVVAVELEGRVQTAVVVVGVLAAAGLVGVVVGSLGTHRELVEAFGLGPVDTEVEVEAEGFQTMDLVVELRVADEAVGVGLVGLVVEQGDRVHRSHHVEVAGGVVPRGVAVQAVGGIVAVDRLGRVVVVGGADGVLVGVPVLGIGALAVEVDVEVLVEEARGEVQRQGAAVHLRALQRTGLGHEAAGHAVRQEVTDAAVEGDVAVVGRGDLVDLLLPVGIGEDAGHAEVGLGGGVGTVEAADQVGDALGVKHLLVLGDGVDGSREVDGHLRQRAAGLGTLLRGDHDDAVGGAGTVDGGRGRVLQDGEALDVFRVDGRERVGHAGDAVVGHRQAVDHVQRRVGGVDGGAAADADGRAGTRHTVTGGDHDARALAAEEVGRGGDDALVDLIGLDRGDGTGEVALLHGAVADDHDLVQEMGVLCEGDRRGHFRGLEDLGRIADAADLDQGIAARNVEHEVAVNARGRAVRRALLHDGGPDHGSQGVDYDSFNLIPALGEYRGACQAGQQDKHSS